MTTALRLVRVGPAYFAFETPHYRADEYTGRMGTVLRVYGWDALVQFDGGKEAFIAISRLREA